MPKRTYTGSLFQRLERKRSHAVRKPKKTFRRAVMPVVKTVRQRLVGRERTGGYYGRFGTAGGALGELKFLDTTVGNLIISATGSAFPLIDVVTQGTGESQRVGRKITLRYFELRGRMFLPDTGVATETSDIIRVILYVDKQTNGATAATSLILQTADINSMRNMENIARFSFLYDRNFNLNMTTGIVLSTIGRWNRDFQMKIPLNVEYFFDGVNGTIDEVRSNKVQLLIISQSGTATMAFHTRVRYSDV